MCMAHVLRKPDFAGACGRPVGGYCRGFRLRVWRGIYRAGVQVCCGSTVVAPGWPMLRNSPEALRIVTQLRERFAREYSASIPRTPLVASARRFAAPLPHDSGDDTTSTALYAALRGTPAAELAQIRNGSEQEVARLCRRALQVYDKAASQCLYLACLRWRIAVLRALIDHPADVRALTRHLRAGDQLVITSTRDGTVGIDMRAASETAFNNPGIIYTRALADHAVFQAGEGEVGCAEQFIARVEAAIRAAERERESRASRSRSTPREVGETRVLSYVYKVLATEVPQACYQSLLALAAGLACSPDEIGRIRVILRAEQPLRPRSLLPDDRQSDARIALGPGLQSDPDAAPRQELVLYEGRNPIDAECCYLWHAGRTRTAFAATLIVESNQPLRVPDARLDLSAASICEDNAARQAQLWGSERSAQAPVTPAQFRAALRLAYPDATDDERYQRYVLTYPGKAAAVRRWATDDGGEHVPRDAFSLLLLRAGFHREYRLPDDELRLLAAEV